MPWEASNWRGATMLAGRALRPKVMTGGCSTKRRTLEMRPCWRSSTRVCCRRSAVAKSQRPRLRTEIMGARFQGYKVSKFKGKRVCPHIRQRKASPPGTRQRLSDGYGPTDGPPVADAGPLRLRALGGCGPPASRLDSTFVLIDGPTACFPDGESRYTVPGYVH